MADRAPEASREENLDWDTLSAPVPMDLIDPEFEPHAPEAEPEPERPGAGSEILPREESEALAQAHDVTLEPAAPESLEDEFSRLRAKMEAEAEAEKRAKLDAEHEEASQRARLDQWMANARARLLKADADLTGPGSRVRIRKESSPSLYRLAEMQKTMFVEGDATVAQSPNGTFLSDGKGLAAEPPMDPMATISVPADQFMASEPAPEPTLREQALARQAAQQAAAQQLSHQVRAQHLPLAEEPAAAASAPSASAEPAATAERIAPQAPRLPAAAQPLTREQALTRKVAQLRKAAEIGSGSAPAAIPGEAPERSALHFAIAAVVVVAIGVLTLALYAATQAGLFDGLENRIPLLKPKMSAQQILPKRPTAPASAQNPGNATASSVQPGPRASGDNAVTRAAANTGTTAVTSAVAVTPASAASSPAVNASPSRSAAAAPANAAAAVPAGSPASAARPVVMKSPAASAPVPANGTKGAKAAAKPASQARPKKAPAAASPAATVDEDEEIPVYARAKPKASNLAEIILNASVQAAYNIDADTFGEIYNRYALGFPGLSGEVILGLTVDPSGRVLQGSIVSSSTGAEEFDQEILKKVLDWKLRAFPDTHPRFVKVPFLFPLQGR
jgi:TonB family protein